MAQVRWFKEHSRTRPVAPNSRAEAVCEALRERPGVWLEQSTHVSKGAAQVAAYRWRKCWLEQEDGNSFSVKVRPIGEDEEKPWSLLLSYKPEVVQE